MVYLESPDSVIDPEYDSNPPLLDTPLVWSSAFSNSDSSITSVIQYYVRTGQVIPLYEFCYQHRISSCDHRLQLFLSAADDFFSAALKPSLGQYNYISDFGLRPVYSQSLADTFAITMLSQHPQRLKEIAIRFGFVRALKHLIDSGVVISDIELTTMFRTLVDPSTSIYDRTSVVRAAFRLFAHDLSHFIYRNQQFCLGLACYLGDVPNMRSILKNTEIEPVSIIGSSPMPIFQWFIRNQFRFKQWQTQQIIQLFVNSAPHVIHDGPRNFLLLESLACCFMEGVELALSFLTDLSGVAAPRLISAPSISGAYLTLRTIRRLFSPDALQIIRLVSSLVGIDRARGVVGVLRAVRDPCPEQLELSLPQLLTLVTPVTRELSISTELVQEIMRQPVVKHLDWNSPKALQLARVLCHFVPNSSPYVLNFLHKNWFAVTKRPLEVHHKQIAYWLPGWLKLARDSGFVPVFPDGSTLAQQVTRHRIPWLLHEAIDLCGTAGTANAVFDRPVTSNYGDIADIINILHECGATLEAVPASKGHESSLGTLNCHTVPLLGAALGGAPHWLITMFVECFPSCLTFPFTPAEGVRSDVHCGCDAEQFASFLRRQLDIRAADDTELIEGLQQVTGPVSCEAHHMASLLHPDTSLGE